MIFSDYMMIAEKVEWSKLTHNNNYVLFAKA